MSFDDISRVCNKFCELLEFSSSQFKVRCLESSDVCEIQLTENEFLTCSIIVTNGSISIYYNGDYNEKELYNLTYSSTIMLLYYLSVIYYVQVFSEDNLEEFENPEHSYLELLSILLAEDVDNWSSLFAALCKAIDIGYEEQEYGFSVGKCKVVYSEEDGKLTCNKIVISVNEYSVSNFSEAIFSIVEYVATLFNKQDDLYKNLDFSKEEIEASVSMGDESNINIDIDQEPSNVDFDMSSGSSDMDDLLEMDEEESSSAPEDLSPDFSEPE